MPEYSGIPASHPGDVPAAQFRAAMHQAADLVADYLEHVGDYPVLPRVKPGEVRAALPASPPEHGEPLPRLLADYRQLIEPNVTHWNHPGFMAYFGITGSGPGILGETLPHQRLDAHPIGPGIPVLPEPRRPHPERQP